MILLSLLSLVISPLHPLGLNNNRGTQINATFNDQDDISSLSVMNYHDGLMDYDANDVYVNYRTCFYGSGVFEEYMLTGQSSDYSYEQLLTYVDDIGGMGQRWFFGTIESMSYMMSYYVYQRRYFVNPVDFNSSVIMTLVDNTYYELQKDLKYNEVSYQSGQKILYTSYSDFTSSVLINKMANNNQGYLKFSDIKNDDSALDLIADSQMALRTLYWFSDANVYTGDDGYQVSIMPYYNTIAFKGYTNNDIRNIQGASIDSTYGIELAFSYSYEGGDNQYWINVGYQEGYENGLNDGESVGYDLGYQAGARDTQANFDNYDETALTIFTGIIDVGLLPINFLLQCLNFEVFGINIGGILTASLTVAIVVILFRVIFNGGSGGKDD